VRVLLSSYSAAQMNLTDIFTRIPAAPLLLALLRPARS